MNTQTNILNRSVRQLAKSKIIQLKPLSDKEKTVGRHENKTHRTSVHTHEGAPTHEAQAQHFDLQAMNYLNNLFSSLLPDVKVVFHNLLYVEQIQDGFLVHESDIFLQFVKTFAQFRASHQLPQQNQVILTNDNDFYLALKLMQKRKLSDYKDIKPKNRNKILDLIKLKFHNRTFTPQIIARELFYNYAFIHRILALLILEREIEFFKEFEGQKTFRLREKPIVHFDKINESAVCN